MVSRKTLSCAWTKGPLWLLPAALLLSGCVIGNSVESHLHRSTTIGQELLDLQRARAEGVINDEEFEKLKEKIKEMAETPEVSLDDDDDDD